MGAEKHNRLRAHALAILIMDHLRERSEAGSEPVTLWSLNRAICERYDLHGAARSSQYSAVRRVVASLEAAARIRSVKHWDPVNERYTKRLYPCSEN